MYKPILNLMASGMLDPTSLITGRYKLEEAAKAMADMKKNDVRIKMMFEM